MNKIKVGELVVNQYTDETLYLITILKKRTFHYTSFIMGDNWAYFCELNHEAILYTNIFAI